MEIHLISALCIVIVGLIFGQPYTHGLYQAVTNEAPDQSKIEENVHNFFDSIAKKNTKMSGAYHEMLEKQVVKEHQAFDAMNEELQSAQNKNFQKRKSFYRGSDVTENLVAKKRETDADERSDNIPIDVYDIGYYEGDWKKFCNRDRIADEFSYFPAHEVKKVRLIVCSLVYHQREFNNGSIAACALYKYCLLMKPRVDQFLEQFLNVFSMNDTTKRRDMVRESKVDETTPCYNTSMTQFEKHCIARGNAFHGMFKQIFGHACTFEGLTTEQIVSTVEETCDGRFMTDEINWLPYCATISLKKV